MSVNKVILLGNVGSDPVVRYPEKDFPVAYVSLATNETRGQTGAEVTEWHNLVFTANNALMVEKYIRKGTRLYAEGKLRSREYTDKFNIQRRRTEIYVDVFEILGR